MDENPFDAPTPTLEELALEANRARFKRRRTDKVPMSNAPWWFQAAVKFGAITVVAFMLLNWVLSSADKKLDRSIELGVATLQAQEKANQAMTAFAVEQLRRGEIDTLILRQMCANDAKSQQALDRCYVTLPQNGPK